MMKSVHPNAVWYFTLRYAAVYVLPMIVVAILSIMVTIYFGSSTSVILAFTLISMMVLIFSVLVSYLVAKKVYESYIYDITDNLIVLKSGILHKQEQSVAYRQIQNVELRRSFVENILGLSSLRIESAGNNAQYAEIEIVGLDKKDAPTIRDYILSQSHT